MESLLQFLINFIYKKINKIKNFLKPDGFIFDIKGKINLNSKIK